MEEGEGEGGLPWPPLRWPRGARGAEGEGGPWGPPFEPERETGAVEGGQRVECLNKENKNMKQTWWND